MNEKNRREKKANNKRFEQHTNSDQARKIRESFGLPKEKKKKKRKEKGKQGKSDKQGRPNNYNDTIINQHITSTTRSDTNTVGTTGPVLNWYNNNLPCKPHKKAQQPK
jgi:hypothetical protein